MHFRFRPVFWGFLGVPIGPGCSEKPDLDNRFCNAIERRWFRDFAALLSPLRGLHIFCRTPTACAVGCILSPLRGLEHCRFYNPLGTIEQGGIFNRFCNAIEGRRVSRLRDGGFATSCSSFGPPGLAHSVPHTHGLRRGLHSIAASRLGALSVLQPSRNDRAMSYLQLVSDAIEKCRIFNCFGHDWATTPDTQRFGSHLSRTVEN